MTPTKNATEKRAKKAATQKKAPTGTRSPQTTKRAADGVATAKTTAPPARELSQLQELIIDTVSDLILSGGHPEDRDYLLYAAMAHYERRFWADASFDSKEMGNRVQKFFNDNMAEWTDELTAAWRANKKAPEQERVKPLTVAERLRANVRNDLEWRFSAFLHESSPEEARLLQEILMTWQSIASHPHHLRAEVHLADAFFDALGESVKYVRVPPKFIGQVEKYVDALKATERPTGAA